MQTKTNPFATILRRVGRPLPGRRRAPIAAPLEILEQRLALSTFVWTGDGDGQSWNDPSNWSHRITATPYQATGTPTYNSNVVFPAVAGLAAGTSKTVNFNYTYPYFPVNSFTVAGPYTFTGNAITVSRLLATTNSTRSPRTHGCDIPERRAGWPRAATVNTDSGSTVQLSNAGNVTGFQLNIPNWVSKAGPGTLVIDTQNIRYPTARPSSPSRSRSPAERSAWVPVSNCPASTPAHPILDLDDRRRRRGQRGCDFRVGPRESRRYHHGRRPDQPDSHGRADHHRQLQRHDRRHRPVHRRRPGHIDDRSFNLGNTSSIQVASGTLDVEARSRPAVFRSATATFGGLGSWLFSGPVVFQADSIFDLTLEWNSSRCSVHPARRFAPAGGINLGYANLAASINYQYQQGDPYKVVSGPVVQGVFGNVVNADRDSGRHRPFPGESRHHIRRS